MKKSEHLKQYDKFPTWKKIADEAFNAGYKEGITKDQQKYIKGLENEIKKLKDENAILYDTDRLTNWIGGM